MFQAVCCFIKKQWKSSSTVLEGVYVHSNIKVIKAANKKSCLASFISFADANRDKKMRAQEPADVLTEEKLQELWSLASQSSSGNPGSPFYLFNPEMYNEQYMEKMKNLQKKKDKKEKRANRERSKNIKSSFVTSKTEEDYDIEEVLKSLGEEKSQQSQRNTKRQLK